MSIAFYLIAILTVLIGWQSGSRSLMVVSFAGASAIAAAAIWYRHSAMQSQHGTRQQHQTESAVPGRTPVSVPPGKWGEA